MALYKEILIDHYRNPRNRGTIKNPDIQSAAHNPSCGDSVSVQGTIADGVLTQIMFEGSGCVISQAAASLLTEYATGKKVSELVSLDDDFMRNLVGIQLGPTRLRCATLVLEALHNALAAQPS